MNDERRSWFLVLILFAAIATLLYWPAQTGGWYLDDKPGIAFNPALKSLSSTVSQLALPRGIVLFSFGLDRWLWGEVPAAFRWVNVALHLCNSLLVVALVRQLTNGKRRLAILIGLLFLCHPVQTAAVSYIVQRMALLSAGFALAALLLADHYFLLRAAGEGKKARLFLLLAICCGILAPLAKENTLLLPLAILLLAWYRRPGQGLAPGWQAALTASILIPLLPVITQARRLFDSAQASGSSGGAIFYYDTGAPLYHLLVDREFLPFRYLLSQLEVFWVYLGLIFLPLHQALDYGWPIPAAVPRLLHLATLLLLGALIFYAFRTRERFPLTFFGVAWIILFMGIESSVLPLDPIFVHRLYLPLVGVLLILYEQLLRCGEKHGIRVLLVLVGLCSLLTWQRNALWGDPVAFWQENIVVAPRAPRPRIHQAAELFRAGRFGEAVTQQELAEGAETSWRWCMLGSAHFFAGDQKAAELAFRQAEQLDASIAPSAFFAAQRAIVEGRYPDAGRWLSIAEQKEGTNVFGLYLRGLLAEQQSDRLTALDFYNQAIAGVEEEFMERYAKSFDEIYAEWAEARRKVIRSELADWLAGERARFATTAEGSQTRNQWATQLLRFELYDEALAEYRKIVALDPDLWQTHYNLGVAGGKSGNWALALSSYRAGLRLSPDNPTILLNYGIALKAAGRYSEAAETLERLLALNRSDGRVWIVYGLVQEALNDRETARRAYESAARLPGFAGEAAGLIARLAQTTRD